MLTIKTIEKAAKNAHRQLEERRAIPTLTHVRMCVLEPGGDVFGQELNFGRAEGLSEGETSHDHVTEWARRVHDSQPAVLYFEGAFRTDREHPFVIACAGLGGPHDLAFAALVAYLVGLSDECYVRTSLDGNLALNVFESFLVALEADSAAA